MDRTPYQLSNAPTTPMERALAREITTGGGTQQYVKPNNQAKHYDMSRKQVAQLLRRPHTHAHLGTRPSGAPSRHLAL